MRYGMPILGGGHREGLVEMMCGDSVQVRNAWRFLIRMELARQSFSLDDLVMATGWKQSTAEAYLSKKLKDVLVPGPSGSFYCVGLVELGEEQFTIRFAQAVAGRGRKGCPPQSVGAGRN